MLGQVLMVRAAEFPVAPLLRVESGEWSRRNLSRPSDRCWMILVGVTPHRSVDVFMPGYRG